LRINQRNLKKDDFTRGTHYSVIQTFTSQISQWNRLFVPSRVINAELKNTIVPRARHVSLGKRRHRAVDCACTFRFSHVRRSTFIDNVDVERNKVTVIAELTYGCVCSLAPGDAATLISKPKVPRSAHVPYKSQS